MTGDPLLLDELEAVTAYESTDEFTLDAIHELATWSPDALPPSLLHDVQAWYRTSDAYAQVIEDVRTGDRCL